MIRRNTKKRRPPMGAPKVLCRYCNERMYAGSSRAGVTYFYCRECRMKPGRKVRREAD